VNFSRPKAKLRRLARHGGKLAAFHFQSIDPGRLWFRPPKGNIKSASTRVFSFALTQVRDPLA
jgi:hypothetical protein